MSEKSISNQPQSAPSLSETNAGMRMPVFDLLYNVGLSEYNSIRYFELETLFLSLNRLFTHYQRIVTSCLNKENSNRYLLEVDIESYIIRFRVILNDIAFIINQLLPNNIRGKKNPGGNVPDKDKEMSISNLMEFFEKHSKIDPQVFQEFFRMFALNKARIEVRKEERDKILHYKNKILVIDYGSYYGFSFISASGLGKIIKTENGALKIDAINVFEFTNSETLFLINFINVELYHAIYNYLNRTNRLPTKNLLGGAFIELGGGLCLFKELNKDLLQTPTTHSNF